MATLEVSHLSYAFTKGHPVLRDVSFSLEEGTITLLAGANGTGKSVLLKTIKGLYQPRQGTITIEGKDCTKDRRKRLAEIGLVFQDAGTQIVGHTVERDIRFGMDNLGLDKAVQDQRLKDVTTLLHLEERLKDDPRTLSGGQLRRLTIAGVLVMQPRILIMDEPFAGLDWPSVRQVLATLRDLRGQGTTILIVSHEAEKVMVETALDLLMGEGTMVADGKPQALLATLRQHDIYIPDIPFEAMTWL